MLDKSPMLSILQVSTNSFHEVQSLGTWFFLTDVLITVPELKVLSLKVIDYMMLASIYICGDHHSNGTI